LRIQTTDANTFTFTAYRNIFIQIYSIFSPHIVDLKFQVNSCHAEVLGSRVLQTEFAACVDAHPSHFVPNITLSGAIQPFTRGKKAAFLTVMPYRVPQTLYKKKVGFYVETDLSNFHGDYSYLSVSEGSHIFSARRARDLMTISEEKKYTFEFLFHHSNCRQCQ
jgi:hypothetical protein